MGRKKRRYRNWRKQMRKRGQRSPRESYTWDYMSPGRLVAWAEWKEGGIKSFSQPTYKEVKHETSKLNA